MTHRDVDTEKTEVEVEFTDGIKLRGHLYIQGMKRASDLLNDDITFIPF